MKWFIRENTWIDRRYIDVGWGNGYVLIPPNHPYYEKHYDDIPVYVHGGLTFSEKLSNLNHDNWLELFEMLEKENDNTDYWVVGFDTAHAGDSIHNWTKEAVKNETQRLAKQLSDVKKIKKEEDNNSFITLNDLISRKNINIKNNGKE